MPVRIEYHLEVEYTKPDGSDPEWGGAMFHRGDPVHGHATLAAAQTALHDLRATHKRLKLFVTGRLRIIETTTAVVHFEEGPA